MFYSVNRPPFVLPCFLHIAVQTQKASLAPIIVIGGWQAEPLGPYWRSFKVLHFYSVLFPACTHSISHSSCCNLSKFVLQKFITCIFTPFAFTLVPITNLTRFWFLFTSGVPPLFMQTFFHIIFHSFDMQTWAYELLLLSLLWVYLLCNKKALYHVLVTFLGVSIYYVSMFRTVISKHHFKRSQIFPWSSCY